MEKFEVVLMAQSLKFYRTCPPDLARRFDHCFEALENNPFRDPHIKLLKTSTRNRCYRYRVGDYRVVYDIDKKHHRVVVHLILPRDEAYRRF